MTQPLTPQERYGLAAHAMQSGVAMKMNFDPSETTPKHLRVGVNAAMVEHSALVELLIAKGLFTREEYFETIATWMEREAANYRDEIQQFVDPTGTTKVTLG